MKKLLILGASLSLLAMGSQAFAQQQGRQTMRPRAARSGASSGISGGTIAVGVGVVAAIAAIALIANNSSSHSH